MALRQVVSRSGLAMVGAAARTTPRFSFTQAHSPVPLPASSCSRVQPMGIRSFGTANKRKSDESHDIEGCAFPEEAIEPVRVEDISATPFAEDIVQVLSQPVVDEDVEIKPDGLLYLPEIKYRRILIKAFGPGGWVLLPQGPPRRANGAVSREYALFCLGKYLSMAVGEQETHGSMSDGNAIESAKSNAMMRCCKDLGIASELWDPTFILQFKQKHCVQEWYQNMITKDKRQMWRRKNRPQLGYPWKPMEGKFIEVNQARYMTTDPEDLDNGESTTLQQKQTTNNTSAGKKSKTFAPKPSDVSVSGFNPDDLLPKELKKHKGKTWKQVLSEGEAGVSYLMWVARSFEGPVAITAQQSLKWWQQAQQST